MQLPRLIKPFKSVYGHQIHEMMSQWYRTGLGENVLSHERAILNHVLPSMFGYHLMQSGVGASQNISASSAINHKFYVSEALPANETLLPAIVCEGTELPIESDSVDVAILHHTLDFHNDPHSILREITRTLIPGGKVIIIGFNPLSCWGLCRLVMPKSDNAPWCGNFLSPFRVSDWLNLLDFQIDGCECVCYGLPTVNTKINQYLSFIDVLGKRWLSQFGAVYTMVATKRVATMTPIKPQRIPPTSLVPMPIKGWANSALVAHKKETPK